MSRKLRTKIDRGGVVPTRAAQFRRRGRNVKSMLAFALKSIVFELGAVFYDDFRDRVREIPATVTGHIILNQRSGTVLLSYHQQPRKIRTILTLGNERDLQR